MNEQECRNLTTEAGFVELHDRFFVRLTGSDRQSFFHNFCTADIKKLQPGECTEALVLNTKGKIIELVHVLAGQNELLLTGRGDRASELIAHLDKYLIREDVTLVDVSEEMASVFVCGTLAANRLSFAMPEIPGMNSSQHSQLGDINATGWNLELAGWGFLFVFQKSDVESVKSILDQHGIPACSHDSLELIRIENKTPWYGVDVDKSNLPQELQRDDRAISFDKGCYLGQETVARIDARGRVNQLLVQLVFSKDHQPAPGDELTRDGTVIGRVTSVAFSFPHDTAIGLGYVRRAAAPIGTELDHCKVSG